MAKASDKPRLVSRVDAGRDGPYSERPPVTGAKSDSDIHEPPQRTRNPYFTALVTLTVVFAAIAVIVWLVEVDISGSSGDPVGEGVASALAGFAFAVAFVMFVATLVSGAINWQLKQPKE